MSNTLERLLIAIEKSGMTPEEFVEQVKEPTLSRRLMLGGMGVAALIGLGTERHQQPIQRLGKSLQTKHR